LSNKSLTRIFLLGLFAITTLVMIIVIELFSTVTLRDYKEPVSIVIPRGYSLDRIASILADSSLVKKPWHFELAARFTRQEKALRAGRYTIEEPLSPIELSRFLTVGGNFDIRVTFPEGFTIYEIEDILPDSLGADGEIMKSLCINEKFLDSLNFPGPTCEGYLFPETYYFAIDARPRDILGRMYSTFRSKWTDEMERRSMALKMKRKDIVTLASIIEAEAKVPSERGVISSVYHNRLRIGMLLQADPTTIYGLKSFDRLLTTTDLDTSSSEYNTYRHSGLPPGPINNPGIESIYAALWPDSTDFLYFVSNGDGTHWFTRTSKDHINAIRAIRVNKQHGPKPQVIEKAQYPSR